MEIIIRKLQDIDKKDCLLIEEKALPGVSYVYDVWDDFTSEKNGHFLGAVLDEKLVGIGKITRLFDGYGWLETLRVHPDYQNKGVGKAVFAEYLKKMEQMNLEAIGMYTEGWNHRSAGLANKFGLNFKARFTEFVKDVKQSYVSSYFGFKKVNVNEAKEKLSMHYSSLGDFIVINRTYFPVREGLIEHVAKMGWIYSDDEGNIAIIGFRFQPYKAIHLAFFHGDVEKIVNFAVALASDLKSLRISAMRECSDMNQRKILTDFGFKNTGEEFVTLWKSL